MSILMSSICISNSKEVILGNSAVELSVNVINAVDNNNAQIYNIIPADSLTEVLARFAEIKIDELQDILDLDDIELSWHSMSIGDAISRSLSDEVIEMMEVCDIDLSWQIGIDEIVDPFDRV